MAMTRRPSPGEKLSHLAVARADFDPRVVRGEGQRREDAFAPSKIAEKMLARVVVAPL